MRFLVTGATGNVGSLVVDALIAQGHRPRLFVRDGVKANERFGGRADVSTGDLADASSLRPALAGIDTLFLVNAGPDLASRDAAAADAAVSAGVSHIVKLSTMDVHAQLGTGIWHARGESAIRSSGLKHTFVQPSGFMVNALHWAHAAKSTGVIKSMTGDGAIPFIHTRDIAHVAVAALTNRTLDGQSLQITGPRALSYPEMVAKLATALGRPLSLQTISDDDEHDRWAARGETEESIAYHLAIFRGIREGKLATVTDGVQRILGRQPVSFDQWIQENLQAFR